jgi:hypothetical protein
VSKSKKIIIKKLAKKKKSCQEIVKKEKKVVRKLSKSFQKVAKKWFLSLRLTALLSAEGKKCGFPLVYLHLLLEAAS